MGLYVAWNVVKMDTNFMPKSKMIIFDHVCPQRMLKLSYDKKRSKKKVLMAHKCI